MGYDHFRLVEDRADMEARFREAHDLLVQQLNDSVRQAELEQVAELRRLTRESALRAAHKSLMEPNYLFEHLRAAQAVRPALSARSRLRHWLDRWHWRVSQAWAALRGGVN